MLHTPRQLHYHDVCKISLWSVMDFLYQSTPNFGRISNSIEKPWDGHKATSNGNADSTMTTVVQ